MLKHANWIAEDVCESLLGDFDAAIVKEVKILLQEKRVHEVYLEPGRVSSRIVADNKRSKRVVLSVPEFGSEVWDTVLGMIAKNPLITAQCYNHHLPFSIKPFFSVHGVSLVPLSNELSCTVDDQEVPFFSVETAAVLEKLAEQLVSNPFGLCTVRGKNVEQIIHEIREKRSEFVIAEDFLLATDEESTVLPHAEGAQEFFEGDVRALSEIQVRADELPASILKRLDPLPIDTPEIEADPLLEDAYGRVARLSQSLARFLPQVR